MLGFACTTIEVRFEEARVAKRQKRLSPNADGQLDMQNQDQGTFNLANDYAPMEYDFGING